MDNFEYFEGSKPLEELSWKEEYGKVEISYSVTEEWERVKARSVSCGEEVTFKFKRRIGIKKSQKVDLSAILKSSIGTKGIAKFESQLTAKVGIELAIEEYIEEEEEKNISAPECKRKHILIYQLVLRHHFKIRDSRFFLFNDGNQDIEIKEYIDCIWTSAPTAPDPECNCEDEERNDGVIKLILGNLGIESGFINSENGLYIEALDLVINAEDTGKLFTSKLEIATNSIPKYLSYIAGFEEGFISARALSIVHAEEKQHYPVVAFEVVEVEMPSSRARAWTSVNRPRFYVSSEDLENKESELQDRLQQLLIKQTRVLKGDE